MTGSELRSDFELAESGNPRRNLLPVMTFLRKTIKPILAMISSAAEKRCRRQLSPRNTAPITTAISGVTSEIIIAFVDSILLKSQ